MQWRKLKPFAIAFILPKHFMQSSLNKYVILYLIDFKESQLRTVSCLQLLKSFVWIFANPNLNLSCLIALY